MDSRVTSGIDLGQGVELLVGGTAAYRRMRALIEAAHEAVDLETYIYSTGTVGDRFRAALTAAAARGVHVRVLVDAYGSDALPEGYFEPLLAAGGEVRWFNPKSLLRLSFRNHRKLLRCDSAAVVGGLNIADEYDGDGITKGWRDFAVAVEGTIVAGLAASFERMWHLAAFGRREIQSFWRSRPRQQPSTGGVPPPVLLLSGPGCPTRELGRSLAADIRASHRCQSWVAYFLPSRRIGKAIRAAARGGRVELMLGARSDVSLSRWASERHFPRYLRAGVHLHDYQPQIVHAKVVIADDIVYIGSANLDVRSLRINFELLLRLPSPALAARLRAEFAADLAHCEPIELHRWRASRRWWHTLRSWVACQLLTRVDPLVARRKLRSLA